MAKKKLIIVYDIAIQKEDFRVLSDSLADKRLVKEFKDLFRK